MLSWLSPGLCCGPIVGYYQQQTNLSFHIIKTAKDQHMPVFLAPRRLKQEDLNFRTGWTEDPFSYISGLWVQPLTGEPSLQPKTLSLKQNKLTVCACETPTDPGIISVTYPTVLMTGLMSSCTAEATETQTGEDLLKAPSCQAWAKPQFSWLHI